MRRWLVVSVFAVAALAVSLAAGAIDFGPGGTFTDEDGNFHEANIEAIAARGITQGCNVPGGYLFCPAGAVTRGQMAAFIDRTIQLPVASQDFFGDDNGSAFEASSNRMAEAGITQGCGPSLYCPERIMSRAEMASLLVRAFGFPASPTDFFGDDAGSLHEVDINALAAAGVTTGCARDKYCPTGAVRRDEMATFLTRADDTLLPLPPPPPVRVAVASITDGDTIRVITSSGNEPLRFIGIDTPEKGDICFGEATNAMATLVANKTVRIDVDVSDRDRFDRLLRYVFLTSGTFVNAEMVRQGWAAAAEFPPDTRWASVFAQLESQAKAAGIGIWGSNCAGDGGVPPPACDPSYPTVCIPPPPPDLDCPQISHKDFKVLPPDPHRFDGDKDGIGCES